MHIHIHICIHIYIYMVSPQISAFFGVVEGEIEGFSGPGAYMLRQLVFVSFNLCTRQRFPVFFVIYGGLRGIHPQIVFNRADWIQSGGKPSNLVDGEVVQGV